jgi:hypothetical protein
MGRHRTARCAQQQVRHAHAVPGAAPMGPPAERQQGAQSLVSCSSNSSPGPDGARVCVCRSFARCGTTVPGTRACPTPSTTSPTASTSIRSSNGTYPVQSHHTHTPHTRQHHPLFTRATQTHARRAR